MEHGNDVKKALDFKNAPLATVKKSDIEAFVCLRMITFDDTNGNSNFN